MLWFLGSVSWNWQKLLKLYNLWSRKGLSKALLKRYQSCEEIITGTNDKTSDLIATQTFLFFRFFSFFFVFFFLLQFSSNLRLSNSRVISNNFSITVFSSKLNPPYLVGIRLMFPKGILLGVGRRSQSRKMLFHEVNKTRKYEFIDYNVMFTAFIRLLFRYEFSHTGIIKKILLVSLPNPYWISKKTLFLKISILI